MQGRLGIAWLTGLLVFSCSRRYVVKEPRVISGTHANVTAYALEASPGIWPMQASTTLLVGALAETKLRGATLGSASSSPCAGSHEFTEVYEDGALQPEGPLDLTGGHWLKFYFQSEDPKRGPLVGVSGLDLSLVTSAGPTCMRIPIAPSEPGSPEWQMAPSSAGLLAADGVRLFALRTASTSTVAPAWTIFTRLGAMYGPSRLWAEFSGGGTATTGYGDLILMAGGDRVLSFMPLRLRSSETGLPFGRRNFFLELELPGSLWFGTGDAPSLVPSAGAGFHVGLGI